MVYFPILSSFADRCRVAVSQHRALQDLLLSTVIIVHLIWQRKPNLGVHSRPSAQHSSGSFDDLVRAKGADLVTVHLRHHHIQQNEVMALVLDRLPCLWSISCLQQYCRLLVRCKKWLVRDQEGVGNSGPLRTLLVRTQDVRSDVHSV